jgi:hypothetical protein
MQKGTYPLTWRLCLILVCLTPFRGCRVHQCIESSNLALTLT